ncbi:MAG: hypothetical protein A3E07_02275 [Candidatus Wildermuthbacteria bacterium RIFCSPHIGHO2_12_FULL_45_9]|uniref:Membrane insertase YidC/Oxa/ALB C-terminal domain-containing protein n=1 Tax=Candidatus Wildermuthbacteria bacterium RIFCSPHIGHO2_02_FULL_45_25 TaxID=1802450 RepID=A0A1G2R0U0_9BACT|nr:MAG: hypothetical protein A3C04_00080 [Candidatus Wildermuthbacteria bacterium RIFCSPHIGHO2_02_FULL_45_25]OHA70851.1 MAG: hypothetical protein A3E07_02275 [Candidatus Wildermuthbacteria bacterium RIFCSPHIGHO2_12_FULL_45_9]
MDIIFGFFKGIYHFALYQPIFNALIILVQYIPGKDFGIAIIVLTFVFRFLTYPLGAQAIRAQKRLSELQPKIKEIQKKFKDKREEQARAVMELYRAEGVNPFASILPLLLQIPLFIVFINIFSHGIQVEQFNYLYSFVARPDLIEPSFLGMVSLNEKNIMLAVAAGILQFIQLKQANPKTKKRQKGEKPDMASMMQSQMMYIFPVFMVIFASRVPAAFGLYLIATTVFSIWQQWFIARKERKTSELQPSQNV